jgi:hypothetical protein
LAFVDKSSEALRKNLKKAFTAMRASEVAANSSRNNSVLQKYLPLTFWDFWKN